MSQQDSKPVPDVWVALIFVSVASLIVGISFLVMELNRYNWELPS